MPSNQTIYKMLLSCPSDLNKYYELIEERLKVINKILSSAYDSRIIITHWTEDTYPASGDTPQNIINKQIVKDSDFLISMFWTKFGSPTEKYNSGTEEEIIEAIAEQKQVFLYFSKEPVNPDLFNSEQYQKVKEFKESISDKAYYHTFNTEEEFLNKLQIHLLSYFDDLRKSANSNQNKSKLEIMSNNNGKPEDHYNLIGFKQIDNLLIDKQKTIKEIMNEIVTLSNKQSNEKSEELNKNTSTSLNGTYIVSKFMNNGVNEKTIEISENERKIIKAFANKIDFEIDEVFFNLYGLKERSYKNLASTNITYEYIGSGESKRKLKKIRQVMNEIYKYYEEEDFFINLKDYKFLSLCLTNFKGKFESDIDIKVYFPKNTLFLLSDIVLPGNMIIENYEEFPSLFFKPKESYLIKEFPHYSYNPFMPIPFRSKSIEAQEKYKRHTEQLSCYQIYREELFDVLEIEISEIKPNTVLNFPSLLPLKIVDSAQNIVIEYKINTRDSSDAIEGEFIITNTHT